MPRLDSMREVSSIEARGPACRAAADGTSGDWPAPATARWAPSVRP